MIDRQTCLPPKIFISHSSHDAQIAGQLIDLFKAAFNLPSRDIRCTSVDGSRLPGGAYTDEQIRREISGAVVLIGLISHNSVSSAYVLFELGARWGAGKPLIPVLMHGSKSSMLAGPLTGFNALHADNSAELYQLVHDIGILLDLVPESPSVLQKQVDLIIRGWGRVDERLRVLLVDDDLTTSSGLYIQIEERFAARYHVQLISDPKAACEILSDQNNVRLCITDLVFRSYSELSGVLVAETAIRNSTPIIVVTGHDIKTMNIAAAELKKIGVSSDLILSKPVTRKQYAAFMRQVDQILLK